MHVATSAQKYRPNFDYDDPNGNVLTPHMAKVKVNALTRADLASVNFGYVYGGSIEAAVYVDTDSNNALSGGDAPFSGVDVTLTWTESGTPVRSRVSRTMRVSASCCSSASVTTSHSGRSNRSGYTRCLVEK